MATQKQIQANRRNAQRSTGPRSAEGKAVSSQNALKTGLYANGIVIGSENALQLQELEAQFTAEYRPATPTERSLVDSLIHFEWMLRRYRWLETEVWNAARAALPPDDLTHSWPGPAWVNQPSISRIHRLRNSTHRAFRETLAELRALQASRPDAAGLVEEPPPQPPKPPAPPRPVAAVPRRPSPIGFVPPDSAPPSALASSVFPLRLSVSASKTPVLT